LGAFAATTTWHGLRLVVAARRGGLDATARARITEEWGRALCRACGIRIEVTGEAPSGGALLVANHRSYVDIPALAALGPVSFLAKVEVAGWPVLGWAATQAGTVFVHRDAARSGATALRRIRQLVSEGVAVAVFPEGTTFAPPGIGPFRTGAFRLAAALDRPVVPVAIEVGSAEQAWTDPDDATFVPHFLRCFAKPEVPIRIAFGPPLVGRNAEELRLAAERWIPEAAAAPRGAAAGAERMHGPVPLPV
jgi:1-acyl-sn-glycerol-3-phosphate acyltransferase